jgi:hypothetical protein
MKIRRSTFILSLIIGFLLLGPFVSVSAQDCTNATPCEQILQVMPGSSGGHLEYGDSLVIKYDGNKTWLEPDVEDWESDDINLKPIEVWIPGTLPGEGEMFLMWEFKVKSKKDPHTPPDKKHEKLRLYRMDDEGNWRVYNATHSDGSIHGGSAHMR